jgi:hypothetical protein
MDGQGRNREEAARRSSRNRLGKRGLDAFALHLGNSGRSVDKEQAVVALPPHGLAWLEPPLAEEVPELVGGNGAEGLFVLPVVPPLG